MMIDLDPEEVFDKVTEELWQYVNARDGGRCQIMGDTGTQVHHIKLKSLGGKNKANNLILLSKEGHDRAHGLIKGKTVKPEKLFDIVKKNEQQFRERMI